MMVYFILFVSLYNLSLIHVSLQPMFRREAIWLQFNKEPAGNGQKKGPAVKISVGGLLMFFA